MTAPVRRPLPPHPKLSSPQVDFDTLPEGADWWTADAVICALGTTRRDAGSASAFRKVDHGYCLAVARLARKHGTPTFVLDSAMGADPTSRFLYTRTKGELERDLQALGYGSSTLLRPGLIGGERDHPRLGEQIASPLLGVLHPMLPHSLRINPVGTIAGAMLARAVSPVSGRRVIPASELTGTSPPPAS